ncbi:MAG: UDP-N-acetylglucosamine 1-carboxyvinyltransferase [Agathobacter sp.]|nr:UDP-N-acetylglucosamine 1-carboxyvinyltransferase [Agathobacter sp.]
MEQYIIKGKKALQGEVEIGGAKNAALAILAAAIMTDETVTIDNLPNVRDINVLLQAIEEIGAKVDRVDAHTVKINGSFIRDMNVDNEFIRKIRASYYLIGALLGKYKKASVVLPGGCDIGSRPIDLHIKGFRAMGANVEIAHGLVSAETEVLRGTHIYLDKVSVGATVDIAHGIVSAEAEKLVGTHIYLDKVSVGATINIMMAAAMADGKTVVENAAKEPHVVDVANFLNSMGANIRGAGTDVIRIVGVEKLHKTEYSVIPDQIEAGTFMFAVAATGGNVLVKNVIPKHLEATTAKLIEVGCKVEEYDDAVRVISDGNLKSTQVTTLPYPGFPTDMQPQMAVLLAIADGTSTVTESIFENRFKYVDELTRMGANIKVEGNIAIISGVSKYTGARVNAPDLRAGAALVIAGLAGEGITVVDDIYYIQRGYETLEIKLRGIGAEIEKVSSEKELQKFILKVS